MIEQLICPDPCLWNIKTEKQLKSCDSLESDKSLECHSLMEIQKRIIRFMKLELIVLLHTKSRNQERQILPPLGMAVVAALTPPDVEVLLTDENVAPINFQKKLNLVGITSLTAHRNAPTE